MKYIVFFCCLFLTACGVGTLPSTPTSPVNTASTMKTDESIINTQFQKLQVVPTRVDNIFEQKAVMLIAPVHKLTNCRIAFTNATGQESIMFYTYHGDGAIFTTRFDEKTASFVADRILLEAASRAVFHFPAKLTFASVSCQSMDGNGTETATLR